MRKLPLLLIAALAAFAAAPAVVHAKDTGSDTTTKKLRPFATEEQAVKDAQKELKDARKKNDKDAITAAQQKLADAQKALADAKKAARDGKKTDGTTSQQ